jgi:hypothetical protein
MKLENKLLQWFNHVEVIDRTKMSRRMLQLKFKWARPMGRPRRRWSRQVLEYTKKKGKIYGKKSKKKDCGMIERIGYLRPPTVQNGNDDRIRSDVLRVAESLMWVKQRCCTDRKLALYVVPVETGTLVTPWDRGFLSPVYRLLSHSLDWLTAVTTDVPLEPEDETCGDFKFRNSSETVLQIALNPLKPRLV